MADKIQAAVIIIDGVLKICDKGGKIVDAFQNLMKGRGRHNLVMGIAEEGDQLLYEESTRQAHGGLLTNETYTFEYRCKGNETISCVVVRDNWDDDTGGNPEKVAGGPGDSLVKIKVTSMKGRGMDFSFYVYGRKK